MTKSRRLVEDPPIRSSDMSTQLRTASEPVKSYSGRGPDGPLTPSSLRAGESRSAGEDVVVRARARGREERRTDVGEPLELVCAAGQEALGQQRVSRAHGGEEPAGSPAGETHAGVRRRRQKGDAVEAGVAMLRC